MSNPFGGGSQKTVTQNKLPKWLEDASKAYLSQAQAASAGLAQPYQGQTVAGMTPEQKSMMDQIYGLSNFELNPETIQAQFNPYIANVENHC